MDDKGPRRKKPKLSRGEDDFMPGSITRIELCNFMVFSKLVCTPCSRLNLVVGPNGTGKSSIVCAIALGLGGEPQVLGRAGNVGAYVRHGSESGYIKISLRGERKEEPITITRKIDARNKSEWLFNGKVASKKEICEVIQRFNIQVNNLTQFLPQDRVCEFAKLTPVQLLEETEKAVGDPQLPVQHHTLISKSQELKKLERTVESNRGSLDQLKGLNADQERDVERVRQREGLLAKAESMKKKLPWLEYDMKRAQYEESVKQEKDAQIKLAEAVETLKKLREPIKEKRREKAEQEAKFREINGLLDDNVKERDNLLDDINSLGVQIRGKYGEVQELKHQEESRQQRICKAKEDLAAAEFELSNIPPYEPPKNRLDELNHQIIDLDLTTEEMRTQKLVKDEQLKHYETLLNQCNNRLREMENASNKRLSALKKSGAEKIFEAYQWVKGHSAELKRKVYGPVLLEVNVANRFHANCLEAQVANYMWKAFITQDSRDRDLLVGIGKQFGVPIINYEVEARHRESFQPNRDLQALGITSRLDQVFEAPDAVRGLLIDQFHLNHSYLGSKETDRKADQVLKLGIMNMWTPDNHYSWSTSRYGNHVSASVFPVDDSRLLHCGIDNSELEKLKSEKMELEENISTLRASLKELQASIRQKEDEAGSMHREREEIHKTSQSMKKKLKEAEHIVYKRKAWLKSLESEDRPDSAMAKLIEKVKELKNQRFQCALKIKNLLIEAVAYRRKVAENTLSSFEFEAKIKDIESNAKEQEKLATQAQMNLDQYKQAKEDCRRELSAAKEHAESIAKLTNELKRAFLEMPTTVEDLKAAIHDTTSEANDILFLNANILEEYESRQRKIEELTDKQETDTRELNNLATEINALKERWLPTLRSLVTKINETFGAKFQQMAVAGEVSLDEHGMDFDKYGILIKVKFRQTEQLQVLRVHHQSGGERSVSTILYLISLQEMTSCPFRVVDEINQGMDAINERRMFSQLVQSASQPNTPQCFLLTPKLLPDLEYSDACSILNVMNGPWVEQPAAVWSNGGSWGSVNAAS